MTVLLIWVVLRMSRAACLGFQGTRVGRDVECPEVKATLGRGAVHAIRVCLSYCNLFLYICKYVLPVGFSSVALGSLLNSTHGGWAGAFTLPMSGGGSPAYNKAYNDYV
jgi:hypothetical protein